MLMTQFIDLLQSIVCCMLYVVCCMLYVVCCMLYVGAFIPLSDTLR